MKRMLAIGATTVVLLLPLSASVITAQSDQEVEQARAPQPPTPAPPPPPAPSAPSPRAQAAPRPRTPAPPDFELRGQPTNVKIELTITDTRPSQAPITKTVTMIVGDRETGMIRSEARDPEAGEIPLHVDAGPTLLPDGRVRLRLSVSYDLPRQTTEKNSPYKHSIREGLAMLLESGKPLVVAQSADPLSDRKVTVEVKATVLK
ncbi:MAG: hypothetical protein HYX76_03235 [Acidobacteria bacterium]|nr:hypothetical protein [Acidobacteriota bacterium]